MNRMKSAQDTKTKAQLSADTVKRAPLRKVADAISTRDCFHLGNFHTESRTLPGGASVGTGY